MAPRWTQPDDCRSLCQLLLADQQLVATTLTCIPLPKASDGKTGASTSQHIPEKAAHKQFVAASSSSSSSVSLRTCSASDFAYRKNIASARQKRPGITLSRAASMCKHRRLRPAAEASRSQKTSECFLSKSSQASMPCLAEGHVWVLAEPFGAMAAGTIVQPVDGSCGIGRRAVARLDVDTEEFVFIEMVSVPEVNTYAACRIAHLQRDCCEDSAEIEGHQAGAVCAQPACDAMHQRQSTQLQRHRPALPACLYCDCIAPFLCFTKPLPNMLYAIGGRNTQDGPLKTMDMFDTWHGKWVSCPPMPCARAGATAAALPDGQVMVIGGYDSRGTEHGILGTCDIYDPVQRQWVPDAAASLLRARWGHGAAVLGGFVFVVGGCSRRVAPTRHAPNSIIIGNVGMPLHMETLGVCERYDPELNQWKLCGELRVPRAGARVTALQNRFLAAVGGNEDVFGQDLNSSSIELYDIESDRWSLLRAHLSVPRATAGVANIDNSHILVVGGCRDGASVVEKSAEIYRALEPSDEDSAKIAEIVLKAGDQLQVPAMLEGRMGTQAACLLLPRKGGNYPVALQRCIAVVGGETMGSLLPRQLASVPVFDVEQMAWRADEVVPPMPTQRTAAAVCVGYGHAA